MPSQRRHSRPTAALLAAAAALALAARASLGPGFAAGPALRRAPAGGRAGGPVGRRLVARRALDKGLVQSTWKAALPEASDENLAAVGTLLFENLFQQTPAAVDLFPFMKGDDREAVQKKPLYKAHVSGVVKVVNDAVNGLDSLEDILPVLEALGRRHNNYKTEAPHYDLVGTAFLTTLEQALEPKGLWTPEAKESWTEVWGVVAHTMKKGQGFE